MDNLFTNIHNDRKPLAEKMRPKTLNDFVGQQHILGQGKLLRRLIEAKRVPSVIFYGPPGTGKTILASIMLKEGKLTYSAEKIIKRHRRLIENVQAFH